MSILEAPVWVIVGTRPEVIKQVSVYRALVDRLGRDQVRLVGSGQHRELLVQALAHFEVQLDTDLALMEPGQALGKTAARVLSRMEEILSANKPRWIVVQGDTTTAAMAAIAAFHNGVRVCHNEAGLRTYDLANPWPEEANRRWISAIADIHLAPTTLARDALLREGVARKKIHVVGNPGIDSLHWTLARKCPTDTAAMLQGFRDKGVRPVLVTAHRRENDSSKMDGWFASLAAFLEKRKDIALVCPMHPNLRAAEAVKRHIANHPRVWIGPPLDYASICHVLNACRFIVTDSGGLQEESATLGIPSVVCRKVTERMEAVNAGIARLADPAQAERILKHMAWAYSASTAKKKRKAKPLFGDGKSGLRAAKILSDQVLREISQSS